MNNNIRISKEFKFETGHALYGYDGLCKNVHGHSYKLTVTLVGTPITDSKNVKQNCGNGNYADIGIFSFHPVKHIACGEGGMISTNNFDLYQKCKSLRNLSFGKKQRFNHDDIAWNYRMTNIQATLGISQLSRIKNIVKIRHKVGKRYYQHLSKNKNILYFCSTKLKIHLL